jgi:hypothetical protein
MEEMEEMKEISFSRCIYQLWNVDSVSITQFRSEAGGRIWFRMNENSGEGRETNSEDVDDDKCSGIRELSFPLSGDEL